MADEQGSLSLDLTEFSELLDDLEHDLIQIRWKEAARHLHGGGLKDGGEVWLVKRELDHYAKEGNWQEWALDYLVVVGGQWPRARQVEAGYLGSDICQRCFGARETLEHRIWTCPCNAGKPAYDQTQHLVGKALAGVEACPALWLRGINPRANTIPAAPSDVENILYVGLPWAACARQDLFVFGDASGGAHAEDPRRRRVGVAINTLRASSRGAGWELEAGALAPLPPSPGAARRCRGGRRTPSSLPSSSWTAISLSSLTTNPCSRPGSEAEPCAWARARTPTSGPGSAARSKLDRTGGSASSGLRPTRTTTMSPSWTSTWPPATAARTAWRASLRPRPPASCRAPPSSSTIGTSWAGRSDDGPGRPSWTRPVATHG